MTSCSTFVSQPGFSLATQLRKPQVCETRHPRLSGYSNSRSVLSMSGKGFGGEKFVPVDTNLTEPASNAESPELIVDISDEDLQDEDLEVVDALGSQAMEQKRKKIRKRTGSLLKEITLQPKSTKTSDADSLPPVEQDETAVFVRSVVRSADERKAKDILALRITKLSYVACFVVVITGNNTPQLRAIANLVEENLAKEYKLEPRRTDGTANSGWMLLDYGDFLVNIFSPEQRTKYNLEGLWRKAEKLDISDCLAARDTETPDQENNVNSLDDWLD